MADAPESTPQLETTEDQKFPITVNGVEYQLTMDELKQWASKGQGAEEKFRLAAEQRDEARRLREEAESAIQFKQDLEAARSGDVDAFRRVAKNWDMPDDQVEYIVQQHHQSASGEATTPEGEAGGMQFTPQQLRDFDRMQKFFKSLEEKGITDPANLFYEQATATVGMLQDKSKNQVREVLTRDPILGRIMRNDPDNTILEDVWAEVEGRVSGGKERIGPKVIEEAVKKERAKLETYAKLLGSATNQQGAISPGALGTAPSASAGFSRLQPPKKPVFSDFKNDVSGYTKARAEYDAWQAQYGDE
jgi:hypothetical protein